MLPKRKWLFIASLFVPAAIQAQPVPYIRLSAGLSSSAAGQNQTTFFNADYWKTNIADRNKVSPFVGGIALGLRMTITPLWEAELGVGLYQMQSFTQHGKIYQYNSPEFYNTDYLYKIQHRGLLLEGKLLTRFATIFHPYMAAGIGISRNHSYGYQETPLEAFAEPDAPFAASTESSLTYAIGLGVDIDIAKDWRIGAGYQFSDLGIAKLGASPDQLSSQKISTGHIKANQFMLQLTCGL